MLLFLATNMGIKESVNLKRVGRIVNYSLARKCILFIVSQARSVILQAAL
jgi:hypothetical protein